MRWPARGRGVLLVARSRPGPFAGLSVLDVGIAALLLVLAVATTFEGGLHEGPLWLTLPVAVVMTAATAWRTRAPLGTVAVVLVAGQVQALLGQQPGSLWAFAVYLLATYSVAVGTTETRAAVGGVAMVGVQWWQEWQQDGSDYLFIVFVFGGAWLLGRLVQQWQGRARQAELDQEERARLAVAEERARIARELHDIVAHGVSVIAVQADAAEAVLAHDPERAREPIDVIRRSSRDVLDEMRRLLQLLRMVDPQPADVADAVTPQPTLEQLGDLVDGMAAAGLPVTFRWDDDDRSAPVSVPTSPTPVNPVPTSVALSAYRIVQEALTNVLKHAGPTPTAVSVRRTAGALVVDVVNGPAAGQSDRTGDRSGGRSGDGSGHGLVGMGERVALVGGDLRAGPRPDGGFEVHAVLPFESDRAVTAP